MNDIKTRPKVRDIKIRDAATLAPRELSRLLKEKNNDLLCDKSENDSAKPQNTAVNDVESNMQRGASYAAHHSYQGGKQLAQKRYDRQFRTTEKTAKQADTPSWDGRPVSDIGRYQAPEAAQGKHEFQRKKLRKQGIEIRGREVEARPFGKTAEKVKHAFKQRAKAQNVRKMQAKMAQKASKQTTKGVVRLAQALARVGRAIAHAAVGLLGGAGALIALVLVICGAAAIIATPFGVFWSGQDKAAQSVSVAVMQINAKYNAEISRIQAENPASRTVISRIPGGGNELSISNWKEVVAVFAVKTAGADFGSTDVVTIDTERIDLLSRVFWDMNELSYEIKTVSTENGSQSILHITITSKSYAEMPDFYGFSKSQRQALTEMMKPQYSQMLSELVGTYGEPGSEIFITPEQIADILKKLPNDLSAERKAVLTAAYSLVGKVNYFWGGKSAAIGWDSRWGTPTKVTAPGSRTSGTTRPYGLDCSGFVDWTFNNALGIVIGQGGGTNSQLANCTSITWKEALPGDIVFYPDISHVGIFAGVGEDGSPLIIHCASSQNNVVLTGLQGFTVICRPGMYAR
ncbi:MAG: NlpC/P60 family protein [Oscillospiraceae bacterium]